MQGTSRESTSQLYVATPVSAYPNRLKLEMGIINEIPLQHGFTHRVEMEYHHDPVQLFNGIPRWFLAPSTNFMTYSSYN
jgi:hypothetical protein